MNKKEHLAVHEAKLQIYNGIIANNPLSENGIESSIKYSFDCPEFLELKEKYNLEEISGKGSDFVRAKRLLNYLAPRLHHSGYYDNHIECNSLALLEYSFDNPDHGINCLNKSKIYEECLLALGIYARRCFMMPYSPFDMDNHVVVEIYDKKMKKWIMLDPTTNCYVVNKNLTPLSLLEMREHYGDNDKLAPVESNKKKFNFQLQYEKNIDLVSYYSKNCFYFFIDEYSTFGDKEGLLTFAPNSFNYGNWMYKNSKYRLKYLEEHKDEIDNVDSIIKWATERLEHAQKNINEKLKINSLKSYETF